ncbi:MAG: hypothetical protein ACXWIQ_16510 [Caldimonas sp.]
MISRLTFSAVVFAAVATATLSLAAESQHLQQRAEAARSVAAVAAPSDVVVLPRVEVTGRRVR